MRLVDRNKESWLFFFFFEEKASENNIIFYLFIFKFE